MSALPVEFERDGFRVVHRRVLHFDFAASELAGGLRWAESA